MSSITIGEKGQSFSNVGSHSQIRKWRWKQEQSDRCLAAAFQMKADTIFIISDGYPVFERALFGRELEEYERRVAEAEEKWAKLSQSDRGKLEKKNKESAEKYWKELDAENAKRALRGLPPKVFEEGGPGGIGFNVGRPYRRGRLSSTFAPSRSSCMGKSKGNSRRFTPWPMAPMPAVRLSSKHSHGNFMAGIVKFVALRLP
jgi:hypothetical protein